MAEWLQRDRFGVGTSSTDNPTLREDRHVDVPVLQTVHESSDVFDQLEARLHGTKTFGTTDICIFSAVIFLQTFSTIWIVFREPIVAGITRETYDLIAMKLNPVLNLSIALAALSAMTWTHLAHQRAKAALLQTAWDTSDR